MADISAFYKLKDAIEERCRAVRGAFTSKALVFVERWIADHHMDVEALYEALCRNADERHEFEQRLADGIVKAVADAVDVTLRKARLEAAHEETLKAVARRTSTGGLPSADGVVECDTAGKPPTPTADVGTAQRNDELDPPAPPHFKPTAIAQTTYIGNRKWVSVRSTNGELVWTTA